MAFIEPPDIREIGFNPIGKRNLTSKDKIRIKKRDKNIYKLSRLLLSICSLLKRQGEICKFYSDEGEKRKPFFEVFLPIENKGVTKNGANNNDEQ